MPYFENTLSLLKDLLHPRIIEYCLPLFNDGHYKQAAYEAFIHIENSLKQKLPYHEYKFTRGLINFAYKGKGYKLKIPFNDDLQKKAHDYFDSVFAYYRNYIAHEPKQIDLKTCVRLLIIASELLEMIDASVRPFKGLESVDDLIKSGLYKNRKHFLEVLNFLEGQYIIDEVSDGFFEDIYFNNINDEQYEKMFEMELITMNHGTAIDEIFNEPIEISIDTFVLTPLGAFIKHEIEKNL